jgi:predicted ATP-dependent protease
VVVVGEPYLYYLLRNVDSEFAELFKVKVDFSPWMARTLETEREYAGFIANQCTTHELPDFSAPGVARVVEEASRLAGNQTKLTTRFRKVTDLLREAAYHARVADRAVVDAADVDTALAARDRRNLRPYRELLDLIRRGTLGFDPAGQAVGQLYGIALLQPEEEPFGRPIRVMASAFLGTGGVVNIEREASLSGPIHNKGFLVLSGYLGSQFARHRPLILSASLSFDQLYEEVEGDSASVAELVALLSAIGGVPLHQGIGVTGALNQEGLVLPVGGVTQKVEGFFDACREVGLDGNQGVVLPKSNLENLTLNAEVRSAVDEGRFRVWAVDRVEQVWPILAGLPAGEEDAEGRFSEGSVHARVADQLDEWADGWRAFGSSGGPGGEEG